MSEALLTLALQALDDPDALPVLGDLILETGWNDDRAWTTVIRLKPYKADPFFERASLDRWRQMIASHPTRQLALAVAAVLLFGNWPTRWPLADDNARAALGERLTRQARVFANLPADHPMRRFRGVAE